MIAAFAAATAIAAYLAGMPVVAAAAVVTGIAGDALTQSAPAGELVFGAGLVIAGLVSLLHAHRA